VKSAQEQYEKAQRRLANVLGKSNPVWPKAWAKDLEQAKTDVAYWAEQVRLEQNLAVELFAPAPEITPSEPKITYYQAPPVVSSGADTNSILAAIGAVAGIVLLSLWVKDA